MQPDPCTIEGCQKQALPTGWCLMHYTRWKRHGDPMVTKLDMRNRLAPGLDPVERLLRHSVEQPNGCRLWVGFLTRGYGRITVAGVHWLAHRLSYTLFVGPIPDDLPLDHTCHNDDPTCTVWAECEHRACIEPTHLDPVPLAVNTARSMNTSGNRTHCPKGHAYEGENLYVEATTGRRRCLICTRETKRAWKARQRVAV